MSTKELVSVPIILYLKKKNNMSEASFGPSEANFAVSDIFDLLQSRRSFVLSYYMETEYLQYLPRFPI